ncbi:MAG: DUF971 domain-containing protein [Planctomycetales bacterium]
MDESNLSLPRPQSLQGTATGLTIAWDDGRTDQITWKKLRDRCPCATCRVARDRPPAGLLPVLKPEELAPVKGKGMQPVGNYAYQIQFSDGHSSGIYSLELLRILGGDD